MRVSRGPRDGQPSKFFHLAHLPRLQEVEQVAAVCYRVREGAIEFLLVKTRGGRWTFPKGGVEPGLTHAQAAALEAFEEAGVHGRIEEAAFTRYLRRNPAGKRRPTAAAAKILTTNAYLCEVLRLESPPEAKRDPTWFSVAKAKQRLREDRESSDGSAMARVVARAVTRIQRLHRAEPHPVGIETPQKDALMKVAFEAAETAGVHLRVQQAAFGGYANRQSGRVRPSARLTLGESLGKVLRLTAPQEEATESSESDDEAGIARLRTGN